MKVKDIIAWLNLLENRDHAMYFLKFLRDCGVISYLDSGMYSTCYRVGNLVIKVGRDHFHEATTPLLKNPVFQKRTPRVFWIHRKGFALICKFVKIQDTYGELHDKWIELREKVKKEFESANILYWDLHEGNLVFTEGEELICVDYGCLRPAMS